MEGNSENINSKSPTAATTAGQKKLKQTRLPFAILSPISTEKAVKISATTDTNKKRKLSGDESEVPLPAAKVGKVQAITKKNTVQVSEIVDLIDDSDDDAVPESIEPDSSETIKIKLPMLMKKNNKKLKLDQSSGETGEQKHHSKTKKSRSHKKEGKHKSKSKSDDGGKDESVEVVCLDDDDDEPKPLETSVVEETKESELEDTDEKGPETEMDTSEGLPKPDIQEIEDLSDKVTEKSEDSESKDSNKVEIPSQDETASISDEKALDDSKLDQSIDLNESLPRPSDPKSKPGTPGSGIKRSHHKKLSEEEKLKRQHEREEARRLERESKEAQKRLEREAKEQQRLREKQEREAKLQKEREEKETQKRIEKEEREKKKQAELEQKAEEKRQKVSFLIPPRDQTCLRRKFYISFP